MKEEEKANKRIKDLSRRQEFVTEMHRFKNEKFAAQDARRKFDKLPLFLQALMNLKTFLLMQIQINLKIKIYLKEEFSV